ncbi:MAG: entericidin A/B family lipoprotein [Verrucomicrobia bacterium]|nr:entericidin A/B family lipoprotein [Verrucomicrobiota bacterium]
MKKLLFCGLAVAVMSAFSACSTMKGMGQDLQSMGHGVQRAAEWCTPE